MTRAVTILLLGVAMQATAQKSIGDLTQKYNAFRKTHPSVALVLTFNQDKYAPGDTAWFKALFLNSDRSPVKGRQLINLALVSSAGKILQSFLFVAKDGAGFNQIVFPTDIEPGIYTLAAYNSWMKNFSPPPLFSKQVAIVGEKEVLKDEPSVVSEHRLNVQHIASRGTVAISFSSQEGSATRFQELFLLVTSNNKVALARKFLQALHDSVSFDLKVSPGIYSVSVIDKLGRVVESRSFKVPAERSDDGLTVAIEKGADKFYTRGKAEVSIIVLDDKGQPVQGEFAFKVLNGMSHEGEVEAEDALSDALLQQSEPWRQIINGPAKKELEFATRFLRKGTAMMSDGLPVPPDTKLVFYLQYSDVILQAQSYSGGRFSLSLPDISGNDVLLAFAEQNGTDIPVTAIVWDDVPIKLPLPPLSHEGDNTDEYGAFAATTRLIDKSFGFYSSGPVTAPALRKASSSALEERLNGVEGNIDVQKYVTFGTMVELIREVVPGLATRTFRDRTTVKVSLPEPLPVAESDPLYIIDGFVTPSTAYFLSLKPVDIARIKLVTSPSRLLPLGLIGRNGIVIVETLKGNALTSAAPWQVIEGIQPQLSFRSKPRADRPDFRSTIFWAPNLETDANGKALITFTWSDDIGPVRVSVTGMTKDGRVFEGEREFEVRLEK